MGGRGVDVTPSQTWANPSTALAATVIDELLRNTVEDLVLAPGSRSGPMALAAAHSTFRMWIEIDERSAGFFALGMAKNRGMPAAVLTTSGTAAANLYAAVIEADESATPLLLLTADRPPEARHAGANQTIDQIKMFGERVRWFADLPPATDRPEEAPFWRSTVCRAIAEASGWRGAAPGPVHLNLGFREPLVPASDDGRSQAEPYRSATRGRPDQRPWTTVPAPSVSDASEIVLEGRSLVVAGSGARPQAVADVLEVGGTVIAEGHSGCRLPGTITTAHHLLSSPAFVKAARPDRAVLLGRTGLSRNLSSLLADVDQVVVARTGWPDPDRRAARLVSDVHFRPGSADQGWTDLWNQAEKTARAALDAALDRAEEFTEPRVARDTVAALPAGGVLAVASSMPVRDLDWFSAPTGPIKIVANRGASGIDGFVSTALGAAAAGGPVVALAGDLSILHDQSGFLVRPCPDLVLVVVNNRGGGIFSFLPQANDPEHFERLFGTPTSIDFGWLAHTHHLSYQLLKQPEALIPTIQTALSTGGVSLLELQTDRTDNVEVHRRITSEVVGAIEPLLQS
jgi:2-succinyl-5-enolpyruvyl-6-hydroxy-3-cyclohexene-1-carboxylate synthase